MRRYLKIAREYYVLIVFTFVVVSGILFAINLIKSEYFAKYLKSYLKEEILNESDLNVDFSRVDIGLFPPKFALEQITVESKANNYPMIGADSLSMRITVRDIFASVPTISYVEIDGVQIELPKAEKGKEVNSGEIHSVVEQIEEKLPVTVRHVIVKNSMLTSEGSSFDIKKAQLTLGEEELFVNVRALESQINNKIFFDGAELSAKVRRGEQKIIFNRYLFSKLGMKVYGSGEYDEKKKEILKGDITFDGEINRLVEEIRPYVEFDIPEIDGRGLVSVTQVEGGEYKTKVLIDSVKSEYLVASRVKGEGIFKKDFVNIEDLEVRLPRGGVVSLKKQKVDYKITGSKLDIKVEKSNLEDVIYFLREDIDGFDLKYSGQVLLTFKSPVELDLNLDGRVVDLYLRDNAKSNVDEILRVRHVDKVKGNIFIKENRTEMEYELFWPEEYAKAIGFITESQAKFKILDSKLNLNRFDHIAELKFEGMTNVIGAITSEDLQDVQVELIGNTDNFVLDGHIVQHADFDFLIDSAKSEVVFKKLRGRDEGIAFDTKGIINILPDHNSKLGITYSFNDPKNIRDLLLKNKIKLHYLINEVTGKGEGKLLISGDFFDPDKLNFKASVGIKELYIEREKFKDLTSEIHLQGENVEFVSIHFEKGTGDIDFKLERVGEDLKYNFDIKKVPLLDFSTLGEIGIGYNALMDVSSTGVMSEKKTAHVGKISLKEEGKINPLNSYGTYKVDQDKIEFNLNAFNSQGIISCKLPFKGPGTIIVKAKSNNVSDLLSAMQTHNKGKNVSGDVDVSGSFSIQDLDILSLAGELFVKELSVRYKNDRLSIGEDNNKIVIKDGVVSGPIHFLFDESVIQAEFLGNIEKDFLLTLNGTVPIIWLEFFNKYIDNATGDLHLIGRTEYKNGQLRNDYQINLLGGQFTPLKDVSVKDIAIDARIDNNRLNIISAKASYGGGTIVADGLIELDFPYPDVNVNATILDIVAKPKKRTSIMLNGKASLTGRRPPYLLQGDFSIPKSEIKDSIDELSGDDDVVSGSAYNQYVPYRSGKSREIILFDATFSLARPFEVENSVAELKINGGGRIKGSLNDFVVVGQFSLVPFQSKVIFKGQEFLIYEGKIDFSEVSANMPSVSLIGHSTISRYRIMLDASGPLDSLNVKFSSEPYLSQNDIISLIALGITSEISQKITDEERQSITSVGLGSLVVDQLKLNEGLSNALGVKLSVLPEFEDDNSSLLQERVGGQSSTIRPSTKLKVQKKINDDVTASVTSTISGADESQKMSVDYMINNKVSVQGLYEVNNASTESNDGSSSSVGADLKFRWEF